MGPGMEIMAVTSSSGEVAPRSFWGRKEVDLESPSSLPKGRRLKDQSSSSLPSAMLSFRNQGVVMWSFFFLK